CVQLSTAPTLLPYTTLFRSDSDPKVTPSDLVVEVATVGANDANPNGDGSGKVVITATAKNAARYAFRIDTGDMVESQTGILDHQDRKSTRLNSSHVKISYAV